MNTHCQGYHVWDVVTGHIEEDGAHTKNQSVLVITTLPMDGIAVAVKKAQKLRPSETVLRVKYVGQVDA